MTRLLHWSILVALLGAGPALAQPPRSLVVETVTARPGATVWVAVRAFGDDILAAQADLVIPPAAQLVDGNDRPLCAVNDTIGRQFSRFGFLPALPRCTPGVDCAAVRALILDDTEQLYRVIPSGTVLYRCALRAPDAGTLAIGCEGARVVGHESLPNLSPQIPPVPCTPGLIEVVPDCIAGDVNRDGTVTISEVIDTVNAALGGCP